MPRDAMAETPNNTKPRKPRCRWFQFRLRTLLVGVVLLAIPCAYVAHEYRIVAARKELIADGLTGRCLVCKRGDDDQIPLFRRWLGDHSYKSIVIVDPRWTERYRTAFPESVVELSWLAPYFRSTRF